MNFIWLATAAIAAVPLSAAAADYPTRAIRMVVPFPAGGTTDILGRIAGQKIT
jgi:tripartite-type tricarboxylate transporter receptor subunit TctC